MIRYGKVKCKIPKVHSRWTANDVLWDCEIVGVIHRLTCPLGSAFQVHSGTGTTSRELPLSSRPFTPRKDGIIPFGEPCQPARTNHGNYIALDHKLECTSVNNIIARLETSYTMAITSHDSSSTNPQHQHKEYPVTASTTHHQSHPSLHSHPQHPTPKIPHPH